MKNNNSEEESLNKDRSHPEIVSGTNIAYQTVPLGDQNKALFRQQLMVIIMNVGMLSGGISMALPSVTLDELTNPAADIHLDQSQASWFASSSYLACPLGSFACAYMADKIGRKKTLIVSNVLGVIAWALMAYPLSGDSDKVFKQLMVSRLMTGIVKGLGGAATTLYGAEICLPKIRARLIMAPSMAMACGVLVIYVLGYFIRSDWQLLGMILLGYQIICLAVLFPVLESPTWLISQGRLEESKASLSYFRGLDAGETHKEVESEFVLLSKKIQRKSGVKEASFYRSLHLPEVYKPFKLAVALYVLQQFSGTFVIIVYAVPILTKAGLYIDPFLCGVYIGIARFFVATFIMTWELEKFTRRQVGIFSALSMAICMFLLAVSTCFTWSQFPYFPAAVVIAFVICCAGVWSLPFVICAEIFPQNVRGSCCGVTDGFAYFMSFFAIKVFPAMETTLGSGNVFAYYGLSGLFTAFFIFMYIPETKGKTLLEIEEYFRIKTKESEDDGEEMEEVFVKSKE